VPFCAHLGGDAVVVLALRSVGGAMRELADLVFIVGGGSDRSMGRRSTSSVEHRGRQVRVAVASVAC